MWPNPQETADLVTFAEEILSGKLHFLSSVSYKSDLVFNCWLFLLTSQVSNNCNIFWDDLKIISAKVSVLSCSREQNHVVKYLISSVQCWSVFQTKLKIPIKRCTFWETLKSYYLSMACRYRQYFHSGNKTSLMHLWYFLEISLFSRY